MSLVFALAYAGHARGSHHKLALDAVRRLRGPDAEAWQRVFLKYAGTFVPASKVPDDEFKDFKNHVLHPRDNYWGGAPIACRKWYDTLVAELRAEQWQKAVYAAGVLSHYVADPIHPFHTAQTEAENAIHRACEWSINRAYDSLRSEGQAGYGGLSLGADTDANWLALLVGKGADKSNAAYEKLIAHYDINTGVVDPPAGLDPVARRIMAELIHYAAETIAVVFTMAFAESGVAPPRVSLTLETVMAAIRIPKNELLKKIENTAERALISAMYDELKATGMVEKTLPADDRAVRDIYAQEVLAQRKKIDVATVFPLETAMSGNAQAASAKGITSQQATLSVEATKSTAPLPSQPAPALAASRAAASSLQAQANAAIHAPSPQAAPLMQAPAERVSEVPPARAADAGAMATAVGLAGMSPSVGNWRAERSQASTAVAVDPAHRARRQSTLSPDADVVDAPSIGPKTAERLYVLGIKTVADLMAADADDVSKRLATRWIGSTTVMDWKAQTSLAMQVPGLRDTHTQLLVGAGYRDARTLAEADPDILASDVLAFATSNEGRRLLRHGDAPDLEKIKGWLAAARAVRAA